MLDHLVYAVPDLSQGNRRVADLLGVDPTPGGRHLGFGSANSLVSLGDACYLEIIGPDPEQSPPARGRPFTIDSQSAAKLVTWAIKEGDLESRVAAAHAAGYDTGEILAMGRARPDGTRLEWRLAVPEGMLTGGVMPGDGLVPFLIDWGPTPHPAESLTPGCTLAELRAEHPEPERVQAMLQALGVELDVSRSSSPALIAVIDSPAGRVEIS